MPRITAEEVRVIARLARLELEPVEEGRLERDLEAILEYVAKLQELDTGGVEPMTHAVPMDCPLREDAVGESLPVERALAGAARRTDDFFEVPRIIDVHGAEAGPAGPGGPGAPAGPAGPAGAAGKEEKR